MQDEHFYTRALKLNPEKAVEYYLGRANYYCLEHEYEKAYQDFCKAEILGAEVKKEYRYNTCIDFIKSDERIEELSKEIQNKPKEYKLYCQRATIYLLKRQYDKAILDANCAIKINACAETFDFLHDLAEKIKESNVFDAVKLSKGIELINAYKLRIKYAENNIILYEHPVFWQHLAEKDMDRVIELAKDKTLALYLKVNFYEKINNMGNAIMYCKKVVEQSKTRTDNFGKVLTYLYEVKLATLYSNERNLKEAMQIALNHPDKPNTPDIKKGLEYINNFAFIHVNVLKNKRFIN